MKYKFLEDTSVKYGYWLGERKKVKAGQVVDLSNAIGERFVQMNKAVKVSQAPSENKVAAPKSENKYSLGEKRAFGWIDILDKDGEVVDKAKGEKAAQEKLKELNGE